MPEPQSLNIAITLGLVGNLELRQEILPLSSLAMGKAGLIKKSTNVGDLSLMHSGSLDRFQQRRKRYRGVVADQGTEKGFGDMSVGIVLRLRGIIGAGSDDSFMLPLSLAIPGFLHQFYNALEHGVKGNPDNGTFLETLQITQDFLNNKQVRNKYRQVCFPPDSALANLFKTGATRHIDWKWEFLSRALDEQLPRFEIIQGNFDL